MKNRKPQDFNLYYIAILPPLSLQQQINSFKETFKEKYGSKASFKSPPHITLHMPFRLKQSKQSKLEDLLVGFTTQQTNFEVGLDGFGAFAPRVIYICVNESESLWSCQSQLQKVLKQGIGVFNADYKNRGFHPHITVAFRDLKKPSFLQAWQEFGHKVFKSTFIVESISLLKHNGQTWDEFDRYPFG